MDYIQWKGDVFVFICIRKYILCLMSMYKHFPCIQQICNRRLKKLSDKSMKTHFKWKKTILNTVEHIVAKWEIAHHEQFLVLPQCFQMVSDATFVSRKSIKGPEKLNRLFAKISKSSFFPLCVVQDRRPSLFKTQFKRKHRIVMLSYEKTRGIPKNTVLL